MRNHLLHSRKHFAPFFCLLFYAASLLVFPIQSIAQTRSPQRERRIQIFFGYNPTRPAAGQEIQFQDFSRGNPSSWLWDFGDGQTSILQNPRHAFPTPGSYKVILTARNNTSSGKVSRTLNVILSISASFTYGPANPVTGQAVQFTDTSTGGPTSWQWNFGDGTSSTSQNPSHAYTTAGSYTVTFTVGFSSGSKTVSQAITVAPSLAASFIYSPNPPVAGQAVQFTDTSTGSPTSWQWSFGDGATSNSQNPNHTYATAASYTVTLTVVYSSGSKSVSQTFTVIPPPALSASFTYSPSSPVAGQAVQFTDTSTGGPTSWQWNFGDSTSSTSQNPSHSYATAASYTVTLTVTNSSGSKSASKTITVSPSSALSASFTYSPSSPAAGQVVYFTDTSTGNPTSWQWNFGDGATSTTRNPSHSYAAAATYTVTLTVTNSSGSKSTSQTVTVRPAFAASFTYSPSSPAIRQAVQFMDTSTGSPTSWQWNFGDNASSSVQNPSHTYSAAGQNWVNLIITKGSDSQSTSQMITVRGPGIIRAASPSYADVSAAVSAAVPGDTIIVPAGTATWSSQLVITKSVSLIGAGIGQTIITSGFLGTEFNSNNFIIYYNVENDPIKTFRVSGFTFDGGGLCEPLRIDNQSDDGSEARIRIDHCTFQNIGSNKAMYWQWGTVYGVVDNCIFNPNDTATIPPRARCIFVLGNNGVSWTHTAYDFGDANNLYFEDCIFYWQSMPFQGGGGGRYAIRHCIFNYIGIQSGTAWGLDNHGNYLGGNYSGFGVEVYDNTWNMNGYSINLIDMRGGKGLIYNNYFQNASLIVAKVREEGSTAFRGHDKNNPPSINPINRQPQHLSDFYIWNTYRNMTKYFHPTNQLPFVDETIDYGDTRYVDYDASLAYKGVVPRENVHFWREVPSFNGSTGMGSGPLSSRPSLCTLEGAAWWATDENRLYRWRNGAWQLYYTPYTYPHLLRK